jgi:hypothetical protein
MTRNLSLGKNSKIGSKVTVVLKRSRCVVFCFKINILIYFKYSPKSFQYMPIIFYSGCHKSYHVLNNLSGLHPSNIIQCNRRLCLRFVSVLG